MRTVLTLLAAIALGFGAVACDELEDTGNTYPTYEEPEESPEPTECPEGEYPMTDTLGRTVCRGEG